MTRREVENRRGARERMVSKKRVERKEKNNNEKRKKYWGEKFQKEENYSKEEKIIEILHDLKSLGSGASRKDLPFLVFN